MMIKEHFISGAAAAVVKAMHVLRDTRNYNAIILSKTQGAGELIEPGSMGGGNGQVTFQVRTIL